MTDQLHPEHQGQTPAEVLAAHAVIARYEWLASRVLKDAQTPPNACRWCGQLDDGHLRHGMSWMTGVGYHAYQPPTDEQRRERILARRAVADMRPWRETNRRFHQQLAQRGTQ